MAIYRRDSNTLLVCTFVFFLFCFVFSFVGLAHEGKDIIVFRFRIEYSSFRDCGPY